MFDGYLQFAGTELISVPRTLVYSDGAGWLRDVHEADGLREGLGDAPYGSPLADEAPWYDPDDSDTWRFWGVLPLSLSGFEDSTRSASVIESIGDGGVVSLIRRRTRQMVCRVLLVGSDERANAAGLVWLASALEGGCGSDGCSGDDLCFLSALPEVDVEREDPTECLEDYWRTFRSVTTTTGPSVLRKSELPDGSAAWTVQFTLVAAVPYAYGSERIVVPTLMADTAAGLAGTQSPPLLQNDDSDLCTSDIGPMSLLHDPNYPPPTAPPVVPNVELDHFALPSLWNRYAAQIDSALVPGWAEVVPRIELQSGADGARFVRFRFYADPIETFSVADLDPCSYCGEFVVPWVPPDTTLVIDGSDESITAIMPGDIRVPAASLVYGSDGGPFEWPALSCGIAYAMTMDVDTSGFPPREVSLSLFRRD